MKKSGILIGGCRLLGGLGIGKIDLSSSNLKIRICIQKLKVLGEMLSPCGRPRSNKKLRVNSPSSSITHAVRFVPNSLSHDSMLLPNPKNFRTSSKNLLDKVSKALAMSMAIMPPLMLFVLHLRTVSHTLMRTS